MTKTDRIAQYLAEGMTAAQIADIVDVTASMISQLQKDERFQAKVEAARSVVAKEPPTEEIMLNNKYHAMEHRLLKCMEHASENADLPAITSALRVVAERQDRLKQRAIPAQANQNLTIVNIQVPAHAIPEIKMNSQNEVIAIGNRALAPMSSDGVRALFEQRKAQAIAIEESAPDF